jgi:hypothetical protein
MRRAAFLASLLLLGPALALASDGGQASVDPTSLKKKPNCPRLPDDISLGGGLYMCARIDCSPPPGYVPPPGCISQQRKVVLHPNGDLSLDPTNSIILGKDNGVTAPVAQDGGAGYEGP